MGDVATDLCVDCPAWREQQWKSHSFEVGEPRWKKKTNQNDSAVLNFYRNWSHIHSRSENHAEKGKQIKMTQQFWIFIAALKLE